MIIDLSLQNFRSYTENAFEFGPGVTIIVGANASGKTNLLEAILVLSVGNSYRGKDVNLIQFEKPWLRIESDTSEGKRTTTIERTDKNTIKKYNIAGRTFSRLPLQRTLPIVVFEPEHLRLLGGSPERRRDYLDGLLEQTIPGYAKLRRDYKRTLAQRNSLLKKIGPLDDAQLFAWNIRLSELGGQIAVSRNELTKELDQQIQELYRQLSQTKAKVSLQYVTGCNIENYSSDLLNKLNQSTQDDRRTGFTSKGPHRDDLAIILDGHNASSAASRGESRTLLLALKVLELRMLEQSRGKKPILLLDDVFSELDGARRRALTSFLKDYQTFITTTDADVVVQHFMNDCTIIPMSNIE